MVPVKINVSDPAHSFIQSFHMAWKGFGCDIITIDWIRTQQWITLARTIFGWTPNCFMGWAETMHFLCNTQATFFYVLIFHLLNCMLLFGISSFLLYYYSIIILERDERTYFTYIEVLLFVERRCLMYSQEIALFWSFAEKLPNNNHGWDQIEETFCLLVSICSEECG